MSDERFAALIGSLGLGGLIAYMVRSKRTNPKNVFKVDGFSGEKGPLKWRAVLPEDIERAWILDHRQAKSQLEKWFFEHKTELSIIDSNSGPDWCNVDEWEPYHPSKLLAKVWIPIAEEFDPQFERTVSEGLVNS